MRLKGGDPFVFGRGGEEAEALAAAGVPFEVVPGITSAIAAPAYAGIPVTHRGVSTSVTVVTGHEDPAKGTHRHRLGRARARRRHARDPHGRRPHRRHRRRARSPAAAPPDTPVAAVRWGTRPEQRTVRATLATIADVGVEAPSAIVVGDVAALDLAWFEQRPLFGRTIVVDPRPRAGERAARASSRRSAREVRRAARRSRIEPVDFTLPDLAAYAWLVFTSANGVDAFFDRGLAPAGLDARALGAGAGRRDRSRHRGRARRARHPRRPRARALRRRVAARRVPGTGRAGRARAARPRRGRRATCCPRGSATRGYAVDVLPVYRTVTAAPDPDDLARVRDGDVDAVTFTSSSTVTNFCDLVGALPDPQPLVVSIGPVTSADRPRARPARRRRGRSAHHRRPRRRRPRLLAPIGPPGPVDATRDSIAAVPFPEQRLRRLRRTPALRRLVAEHQRRASTTSSRRCS